MNMKSVLLSGVAIIAATTLANASDLPSTKAPAAAPAVHAAAHNWTGFSIGLGGGAQYMQAPTDAFNSYESYNNGWTNNDTEVYSHSSTDLGAFSGFGTAQISADYEASGMVIGVFADYNLGTSKADHSNDATVWSNDYNDYNNSYGYHSVSVTVGNSWDVGGRLGFLVNNSNLVYVLGGYSSADIAVSTQLSGDIDNSSNDAPTYFTGVGKSGWTSGWVAGAGWETALSSNWTFKTEYRHADYGTVENSVEDNYGSVSNSEDGYKSTISSKVTVDSVRALLSYKF